MLYVPHCEDLALTLNPRPTSLYHRLVRPALFFAFPVLLIFEFWKMGCFWKAFSLREGKKA